MNATITLKIQQYPHSCVLLNAVRSQKYCISTKNTLHNARRGLTRSLLFAAFDNALAQLKHKTKQNPCH